VGPTCFLIKDRVANDGPRKGDAQRDVDENARSELLTHIRVLELANNRMVEDDAIVIGKGKERNCCNDL